MTGKKVEVIKANYDEDKGVFIFSVTISREDFAKAMKGEEHQLMAWINQTIMKEYDADQLTEISNNLINYGSHLINLFKIALIKKKTKDTKDILGIYSGAIDGNDGGNNGGVLN